MEIYFSRHARRQMRWRRISQAEVEAILREPDRIGPARKGRRNAWKAVGERNLRVTYREEPARLVIVTVVDERE